MVALRSREEFLPTVTLSCCAVPEDFPEAGDTVTQEPPVLYIPHASAQFQNFPEHIRRPLPHTAHCLHDDWYPDDGVSHKNCRVLYILFQM